jgi:hypothetical protein
MTRTPILQTRQNWHNLSLSLSLCLCRMVWRHPTRRIPARAFQLVNAQSRHCSERLEPMVPVDRAAWARARETVHIYRGNSRAG